MQTRVRPLSAQESRHDSALGIAGRVAAGLAPYATSSHFVDSMQTANVPHPFDSHPPPIERMRNVGHEVTELEYGLIVTAVPASCWVSDIQTAEAIESELWGAYEQQFTEAHDVATFEYENGMGADVLTIRLTEKGLLGAKTKKAKLRGISKQREAFKDTLGRYWHRHQTMRQSIPA